jgi:hypothetical protein
MKRILCMAAAGLLSSAAAAWAQPGGDPLGGDQPAPSEPVAEPDPEEPEGPIEDPDIPPPDAGAITADDLDGTAAAKRSTQINYTKKTFPIEVVKRPLTLAQWQAEIALDSPFVSGADSPTMWQTLRARFGITRDWEAGLTYSFGLFTFDPPEGGKSFEAGRAFSFDGAWQILYRHLAAAASLAFYADPDAFGFGINLGVPFRVNLGERWAIFGGHDLLRLQIVKMPVDPAFPAYNLGIAAASELGVEEPAGDLTINVGGMVQIQPNINAYLQFTTAYLDFEDQDQPFSLFGGLTLSRNNRFDLGGRIGFYRLDDAGETFSVSVYGAYRL